MAQSNAKGKACSAQGNNCLTSGFSEYDSKCNSFDVNLQTINKHHFKFHGKNHVTVKLGHPKVSLDKFSFVVPVKDEDEKTYIRTMLISMKTSESFHVVKEPSGVYGYSYHFGEHKEKQILVQADPHNTGKAFMRFELNPAKLGGPEWSMLRDDLLSVLFPHGDKQMQCRRIDIAMDFPGTTADKVLLDAPKYKRAYSEYRGGKFETSYVGSRESDSQIAIYDKAKQANLPNPLVRVEIRRKLKGKTSFEDLRALSPTIFEGIRLYKYEVPDAPDDYTVAWFLAFVREFGFQGAKKSCPKAVYEEMMGKLEAYQWWKPEVLHDKYLSQVDELQAMLNSF